MLHFESTTKTKQTREISISTKLLSELKLATSTRNDDGYLFRGPQGGVLNYEWFMRKIWRPATRTLGIEGFGFHGLRRTCASLMISQHAPVTAVSSILGHASVRTTLDAYAHFYEPDKTRYLEIISDLIHT